MDQQLNEIRKQKHARWLQRQQNSNISPSITNILSSSSSSSSSSKPTRKKRKAQNETNSNEVIDLTVIDNSPPSKKSAAIKLIEEKDQADIVKSTLKLATYNIWFNPPHEMDRMKAIASILLKEKPMIVGFQEVTYPLGNTLFPLLVSSSYQIHAQDFHGYGCALAFCSSLKIKSKGFEPFQNSIMERGLLWIHASIKEVELLFCTTHLESFIQGNNGSKARRVQLIESSNFCKNYVQKHPGVELAILSGDLNWDDERPNAKGNDDKLLPLLGQEDWKDAWKELHSSEGYTYDAKCNPMLSGGLRRRFDRFLIHFNQRSSIKKEIIATELIGTQPIPNLTYEKTLKGTKKTLPVLPSDHFGLTTDISIG